MPRSALLQVWYSILSLAAESALGLVGIYNRMLTWRQHTRFTQVSSADAKRLHRVRCHTIDPWLHAFH